MSVGYFIAGSVEIEDEHVVRIESGIDALQLADTLDQQARADEQCQRERNLGHDECAAHVPSGESRRRRSGCRPLEFPEDSYATFAARAPGQIAGR